MSAIGGRGLVRMGVASLPSDWDEVESGAVGTAWGPRGFHIVAGIVSFWDSLKNPARGCQRTASGSLPTEPALQGEHVECRLGSWRSGALMRPGAAVVSSGGPVLLSLIQVYSTGVQPVLPLSRPRSLCTCPILSPQEGLVTWPSMPSFPPSWLGTDPFVSATCPVSWYLDHLPLSLTHVLWFHLTLTLFGLRPVLLTLKGWLVCWADGTVPTRHGFRCICPVGPAALSRHISLFSVKHSENSYVTARTHLLILVLVSGTNVKLRTGSKCNHLMHMQRSH